MKMFICTVLNHNFQYFCRFNTYIMLKITDSLLNKLADEVSMFKQAFLHKTTHEILSFPTPDEIDDEEVFEEGFGEDFRKWEANEDDYYHIVGMDSRESFQVMEDFAEQVKNEMYRGVLLRILDRPKPFRNYKDEVEYGDLREEWFTFKNQREGDHVRKQLELEMQSEEED
jgi:Uncharacterised protein family (UPF0158)